MPADFDACVEKGGSVRTKDLGNGKYAHVCIPKGGGPSIMGEVKTKQGAGKAAPKRGGKG
jgi:hypothetical protein